MPEEALRYKLARNVSSPWAPCKRDGDKQAKVHRKGVGVVESGNSDLGSNWKWRCFVWRRKTVTESVFLNVGRAGRQLQGQDLGLSDGQLHIITGRIASNI